MIHPAYGARPLKRAIQKHVQNKLAMLLLAGTIQDNSRVHISVMDHSIIITPEST